MVLASYDPIPSSDPLNVVAMPIGPPPPDNIASGGAAPLSTDPRVQAILDCVLRTIYKGTQNALTVNRPFHNRMQLYRRLRRAIAPYDGDPNDPISELYSPSLGALVETVKAQELSTLVPDPASMDNVEIFPEEPGLDDYCHAFTKKYRNNLRTMRPTAAENGYIDLLDRQLEDRLVLGTCFEMSAYQVLSGTLPGEPLIDGAVKEYLDPVNTNVWDMGVTSSLKQRFSIFDPCTDDDLEFAGTPQFILDLVREMCTLQPLPPVDPDQQDFEFQLSGENDNLTENQDAWKRYSFYGQFPWSKFRDQWGKDRDDLPEKDEIVTALQSVFKFDLASVNPETYWEIQHIWPVMTQARPFQCVLAPGHAPIRHAVQYKVPGQFWGEGFYDRNHMHERLANFFQQCAARIAGLLADPPTIVRKHLVDMDHMQLNGITPRLEHGQIIYAKQATGMQQEDPIEPLLYNAQSLEAMNQQEVLQKDEQRQNTGVYADLSGQSGAKLATINANNVQQGMILFQASAARFEAGFMRRGAEADYVILCQAIQELGKAVDLPVSVDNKIMGMLTLTPDMLLPLGPVSIRMSGVSSPSNRSHMVEMIMQYCQTFIPTGAVDVMYLAKIVAQYIGFPSADKVVHDPSGADLMKRFVNATAMLGQGAIQYFSPMALMQLGLIPPPPQQPGGPGQPGQGAPAGPQPGQSMLPNTQPQAPTPQGPGGLMPGNNGYTSQGLHA